MEDKILGFTGDVMLGRNVNLMQRNRKPEDVWGTLLPELEKLDGLFINLECCISKRGSPWTETIRAFHFRADPDWSLEALEKAGVKWCNLANNHMLDFGEKALLDTLENLENVGIRFSGAGRNREEAFQPAFVELDDLKIAFISFSDDPEEYAAGADSPGIAYLNFYSDSFREDVLGVLEAAKSENPDIIVASGHLGPNMVEKPAKRIRDFVHFLMDNGVDLFHGHSAHIFQGIEVYKGKPILYDTGDFIDDYRVDLELRNDQSFLFKMKVVEREIREIELLPVEIRNYAVEPARKEVREWSFERMQRLSKEFGTSLKKDDQKLSKQL